MRDIIQPTAGYKLDSGDTFALVRARRAKSPTEFKKLLAHYRSRGATDGEIARVMAECPAMIDPVGPGRRRL